MFALSPDNLSVFPPQGEEAGETRRADRSDLRRIFYLYIPPVSQPVYHVQFCQHVMRLGLWKSKPASYSVDCVESPVYTTVYTSVQLHSFGILLHRLCLANCLIKIWSCIIRLTGAAVICKYSALSTEQQTPWATIWLSLSLPQR